MPFMASPRQLSLTTFLFWRRQPIPHVNLKFTFTLPMTFKEFLIPLLFPMWIFEKFLIPHTSHHPHMDKGLLYEEILSQSLGTIRYIHLTSLLTPH